MTKLFSVNCVLNVIAILFVAMGLIIMWMLTQQNVEAYHLDQIDSCNDNFGYGDCSLNEANASAACAAAGGSFASSYIPQMCEGTTCSSGFFLYTCSVPHPVETCATNPSMDGCPCTKANACNTTSGSYSGGICAAPEPEACVICDANMGSICNVNACGVAGGTVQCDGSCSGGVPYTSAGNYCESGANSCGMTNGGSLDCSGNCSASVPSDAFCSACVAYEGTPCSASNSCGMSNDGLYQCDGSCSVGAPSEALCGGGCVVNEGEACSASNSCGMTNGGTILCSGACSAVAPSEALCGGGGGCVVNEGNACTRTNSCGQSNTGAIECDGSCSVSAPAESGCPAPLPPPSLSINADRTNVRKGETVRISWDANTTEPYDCVVFGPGIAPPITFNPSSDGDAGARDSAPINAKSVFTLQCTEPVYGTVYSDSVSVETTGGIEEI